MPAIANGFQEMFKIRAVATKSSFAQMQAALYLVSSKNAAYYTKFLPTGANVFVSSIIFDGRFASIDEFFYSESHRERIAWKYP